MRVLVTGWAGYLGTPVVRALKARGHYVIGLDTNWFVQNFAEPPEWPDEVVVGDIRDDLRFAAFHVRARMRRANKPVVDAVVHLAGLSNDPMGDLDAGLTREINQTGTLGILRQYPSARHVVISSCSVYGATSRLASESDMVNPLTAYARAKAGVDASLRFYADGLGGSNAISLRLGTLYGYAPGHRLDLVVNKMVREAILGLGVTVTGDAQRPLTHVEDAAAAIALEVDRGELGIYNVVGENWSIRDLGAAVAGAIGASVRYRDAGGDQRDYAADGIRLRQDSGWEPQHSVAETIPVLARQSLWLPPREYTRLRALNNLKSIGYLDSDLRHERIAA